MQLSGALVFSSGKIGDFDIWKLDLKTNEVTQLTTGHDQNDMPRWSPNGQQIAYVSNKTGKPEIWLMNEFGGDKVQLTDDDSFYSEPSWSPDGKQLVFCSNKNDSEEVEIWTIDIESQESRMLFSSPGKETGPSWSADGRRILFSAPRSGDYDVWQYDLKEGDFTQLTNHKAKDYSPSYSPDGKFIAFVSTRGASGDGEKGDSDIWIMPSDGMGQPRRLTTNKHADRYVRWSPDGAKLVYCASDKKGADRIQIIDLEESKILKLSYDRSELELEIGAEVKNYGLFTSLIPNALQKKFASSKYFGTERYPDWKL